MRGPGGNPHGGTRQTPDDRPRRSARGVARLTTREVATRAGVSEGSIVYHVRDRQSLLSAVFNELLRPLSVFNSDIDPSAVGVVEDIRAVLALYMQAVHVYLDDSLDLLVAAHGDRGLHERVGAAITAHDLGPHRGVNGISAYFDALRKSGLIADDVDIDTAAYLVISATFLRSAQPKLYGQTSGTPPAADIIEIVLQMLTTPKRSPGTR